MKLEAPFKPGNRIYFVANDKIRSAIITSTKLVFISQVDKRWSVKQRKHINVIEYKFSDMYIFTSDMREFTYNTTTPPKIFKTRKELLVSNQYKSFLI